MKRYSGYSLCSQYSLIILTTLSILVNSSRESFISNKEDNWDSEKSTAEFLSSYGYVYEEHKPMTEDGYILTLMRIPKRMYTKRLPPKQPVLIMHGLLDNSKSWLIKKVDQNLPVFLVNNGYDVWIGNNRGNDLSLEHIDREHHDWKQFYGKFWDFSWDQFALHDLPTMIQYIQDATGYHKIDYIGHSQGTTQFFALSTVRTNWVNDNINSFVGLGPAVTVRNATGFLPNLLIDLDLPGVLASLKLKNFMVLPDLGWLFQFFCRLAPNLIYKIVPPIVGRTKVNHFDMSRMGVMGKNEPGGTSAQNMEHWMQLIKYGKFQMFDYGEIQNLRVYGNKRPNPYPISNLKDLIFPIYLFGGSADILVTSESIQILLGELPKGTKYTLVDDYSHLDYIWADNAVKMIYDHIVDWYDANKLNQF